MVDASTSEIKLIEGSENSNLANGRKQIILNAFDMSTIGHLSPGQWKASRGRQSVDPQS